MHFLRALQLAIIIEFFSLPGGYKKTGKQGDSSLPGVVKNKQPFDFPENRKLHIIRTCGETEPVEIREYGFWEC